MPMYRTGLDMYAKYTKKYNPTVIGTRFADVQPVALERAQEGLLWVGVVRDLVRPILDKYGISGGLRATYLAFATALSRHIVRQRDVAAQKIASGLKAYYVQAYGLDPAVLDDIIGVVAGAVAPY